MKFLKLTRKTGEKVFINASMILCIVDENMKDGEQNQLYTVTVGELDNWFLVKETPEQILKMIEEE